MKRKTNKKTGIIAAVVGLSAVSLVSVGFASWVMSGGDTGTIEGTIDVDTVDDQRFLIGEKTLTYGNASGKDKGGETATKIVYGIDNSVAQTYNWLTASTTSTNKYENLDAKLTFFVANAPTASNISVTFAPKADKATDWSDAVEDHLVAAPTIGELNITDGGTKTIQGIEGSCKKVEVSVHFNWGSAFGGNNPYVYYNSTAYSVELSNDAKTKLKALETYLTGMSYVLTITTTAA